MQGFALLRAAVLLLSTRAVFAAVHEYNDDYFYAVADAYIFRGGREGLYASTREVRPAASRPQRWYLRIAFTGLIAQQRFAGPGKVG